MLEDIFFALWFLLPATLANVAPIISGQIPGVRRWQTPLDFGKTYKGQHLFGTHKTWRGIVSGMIVATLVLWLQQVLVARHGWLLHHTGGVNYAALPVWLLGPLFGLGALGGDAIESFFKRRRGIPPGQTWLPFDQLDYIIGGILVSLPFVRLHLEIYIWMLILWFILHIAATYVGFRLKWKDSII